jgi:hypothetical protein
MLSLLSVQMSSETLNVSGFTLKTSDDELVSRVKVLAHKFHGHQSAFLCSWQSRHEVIEIHLLLNCIEECGWMMLENCVISKESTQTFVYTFRK